MIATSDLLGSVAPVELIFLHGGAAAGKLTTARALADRVGYPVFHNHLTVDLLSTVFTFGSEPFVRLRERIWLDVFSDAARAGTSLIFTFAPEPTVAAGFPRRARAAVEEAGGRVHFVRLLVSEAEQDLRVGLRVGGSSTSWAMWNCSVATGPASRELEQPPVDLEIDTDRSGPAETAATIATHFGLRPQAPVPRY